MATLARGSIYGTSKIPTKSENNDDTHQLITSSKSVAEATGILPVVSTLTFGVAVQCVFDAGSPETPVAAFELILLSASASLSVFTTTFSLLEYYYVREHGGRARAPPRPQLDAQTLESPLSLSLSLSPTSRARAQVTMLEGGDAWISYVSQGETADGDDGVTRDVFAHEGWAILEGFSARRKQARDNMWASLALILVALGVRTVANCTYRLAAAVCFSSLMYGARMIYVLVHEFRGTFRPLLQKCHLEKLGEMSKQGATLTRPTKMVT